MKKSLGADTLLCPAPVWGIGSYDGEGKPNVMTASWAGICCSKPPCVSVSLRKATHTFGNIIKRKAFTVNIPSQRYVKESDYFGMVSGRRADKFLNTGLTAVKSAIVDAPYIKEFPVVVECKLIHTLEIGLHTFFIGRIVDVKAEDTVLGGDGMPDVEKLQPFIFDTANGRYYKIGGYLARAFAAGKKLKGPKA